MISLEPVIVDLALAAPDAIPPVHAPPFDPEAMARVLARDGVRVEVRGDFIVRERPDGWVERVASVGPDAVAVATDRILVVVSREDDRKRGGKSLTLRLVPPTDAFRTITLPPWIAPRDEVLGVALAGDQIVFHTPTRAAWLPIERLHWLSRVGGGPLKFCAKIPQRTESDVVVTRGGETRAVVEGKSGKRIMLMTQEVPVALGERLIVRAIDGEWALFNAAGEMVAREDTIGLVRSAPAKSTGHADYDTETAVCITVTDFVADVLKAAPRERLEKLRALGIAPGLDRDGIESATYAAFRSRAVPRQPAIVAAAVLYAHFAALPVPEPRALLGPDAVERAARANGEETETRWYLVTMLDDLPFAIRLSASMHRAIVARDLLRLESVPPYEEPPADAAEARDAILRALGCTADDVALVLSHEPGGRTTFRLSLKAAALLERLLAVS